MLRVFDFHFVLYLTPVFRGTNCPFHLFFFKDTQADKRHKSTFLCSAFQTDSINSIAVFWGKHTVCRAESDIVYHSSNSCLLVFHQQRVAEYRPPVDNNELLKQQTASHWSLHHVFVGTPLHTGAGSRRSVLVVMTRNTSAANIISSTSLLF